MSFYDCRYRYNSLLLVAGDQKFDCLCPALQDRAIMLGLAGRDVVCFMVTSSALVYKECRRCGLSLAVYSCAHRAQLNFAHLTSCIKSMVLGIKEKYE
jgi:hypothetical protein